MSYSVDAGYPAVRIRDAIIRDLLEWHEEPNARGLISSMAGAYLLLPRSETPLLLYTLRDGVIPAVQELHDVMKALGGSEHGNLNQIPLVFIGGDAQVRERVRYVAGAREAWPGGIHHIDRYLSLWSSGPAAPYGLSERLARWRMEGLPAPAIPRGELEAALAMSADVLKSLQQVPRPVGIPVTKAILAAVGIAFVLQLIFGRGNPASMAVLWTMGGGPGSLFLEGEWWRGLTPAFLHGGFLHILFNGMAVYFLGRLMEQLIGGARLLVLYVVSTLGGTLLASYQMPDVTMVGASGALWGLLVAGWVVTWRYAFLLPPSVVPRLRKGLTEALVLNLAISFLPGISLAAHLGGGLAGGAIVYSGLLLGPPRRPSSRQAPFSYLSTGPETLAAPSPVMRLVAFAAAMSMVASVAWGYARGRPWQLLEPPHMERLSFPSLSLSIEVPRGMRRWIERVDGGPFGSWLIGSAGRTPTLVVLTSLGDDFEDIGPKGEMLLAAVRSMQTTAIGDVTLEDGRAWVRTREGGTLVWTGGIMVNVFVPAGEELPRPWKGLETDIARSVRALDPAAIDVDALLGDDSTDPAELMQAAQALRRVRRYEESRRLLDRSMAIDPDNGDVRVELAALLDAEGDEEGAIHALEEAVRVDPASRRAWSALTLHLRRRADPRMLDAARQWVRVSHASEPSLRSLCAVLLDLERYPEALRECARVDGNENDRLQLVAAKLGAGHETEALALVDQLVRASSSPMILNNTAYVLALHGVALKRAEVYARTAVEDAEKDVSRESNPLLTDTLFTYWDTLGTVLWRKGDVHEARSYLEAAWYFSGSAEVGFHLFSVLDVLGEADEARRILGEAASRPLRYRQVELALKALDLDDDALNAFRRAGAHSFRARHTFRFDGDAPLSSGPFFVQALVDREGEARWSVIEGKGVRHRPVRRKPPNAAAVPARPPAGRSLGSIDIPVPFPPILGDVDRLTLQVKAWLRCPESDGVCLLMVGRFARDWGMTAGSEP